MQNNFIKKEKNIQEKTSKSEKYFWGTLILIFAVYLAVSLFVSYKSSKSSSNNKSEIKNNKTPILLELSDIINKNLADNQTAIILNLKSEIQKINNNINSEIDILFEDIINKNIDTYLDFHYSVIGGYTELGNMAISEHSKLLTQKLLGNDFENKLKEVDKKITSSFIQSLEQQQHYIESIAIEGVDLELNSKAIETIKNDIDSKLLEQKIKLGVVGTAISAKILAVVTAKVTAKSALKVSGKVATKMAGAGSAAAVGASAGLICGPGAILCSPIGAVIGAIGTWIATDVVINKVDEHYNREKLKEQISDSINLVKENLKDEYISVLNPKMNEFSNQIQKKYKNTKIKDNL